MVLTEALLLFSYCYYQLDTERLKCRQDRAQLISYQLTQGRGKIAKMLHVVINISMNKHREVIKEVQDFLIWKEDWPAGKV